MQENDIDIVLAPYGARRLSTKELEHYKNYLCGWQVEIELEEDQFVLLDILLDREYPHSIPSLFLVSPKLKPLDIPHLEKGGKLCVWNDRCIINAVDPAYIIELLRDTTTLLNDAFKGRLNEDFRDEFLSYWAYHCKSNSQLKSLCNIENKHSRQVYVYKSKSKGVLFADSKEELVAFLDNEEALPKETKVKPRSRALSAIQSSALICFEKAWLPCEYPSTAGDLISLIEKKIDEDSETIISVIGIAMANHYVQSPCLIVSFDTKNGVCLIALEFSKNLFYRGEYHQKAIMDGFRQKIRVKDLIPRIKHLPIKGTLVRRVDQSWLMGRDVNHSWKEAQTNRVAIIGCGSVGAASGRLLVQSGVNELLLFDGDTMKSENISRHSLGIRYLGWNKAAALSHALRRDFPHLIIHVFETDWQESILNKSCKTLFERSDLILSCTADWFSDQKLLSLQSDLTLATIVFSFVEAHAMAAHVIVNPVDSNAYNSIHFVGTDKVGKMMHPVTEWQNETLVNVPACAGAFQPYGAIPLTHLHAMTADQIMSLLLAENEEELKPQRKVWFDSKNRLNGLGGDWSTSWVNEYGAPGVGNYVKTLVYVDKQWIAEHD